MLARFVNAADFFDPPLEPLCPMLNPVGFGVKSNVELAFECGASSGVSTAIGSGDGGSGEGISISSASVSSTTGAVVSAAAAAAGAPLSNCAFKSRIARGRSLRPRPLGVRFIGLGEVLVGIAEN